MATVHESTRKKLTGTRFPCPDCGSYDTKPDKKYAKKHPEPEVGSWIERRYNCRDCNARFATGEVLVFSRI